MTKLPDLEGLAIFAKVAECRSFSGAAEELQLSRATVSKAVSRIEDKLGARLIFRTARRFGEAAEHATRMDVQTPRGVVRLAAPVSFGASHVAPLLPEFLAAFPEISIDLHMSDAMTDVIGEGFDAAIRLAVQPGAALMAQRLREMPHYVVGSPSYLARHGRPTHPLHLAEHRCI